MDIHDAVELVYSEIIRINKDKTLTGKYNIYDPRQVIALLIESDIITKDIINSLHKNFIFSRRDERLEVIKRWLEQDSVLYQKIFRSTIDEL